jgi:hypothetical protein
MSDCLLFDEFQRQTMHAAFAAARQSIVAAVQRKKIYCKVSAYQ